MSFLKVTAVLGLVLIFTHHVSPFDFSVMNFARSTLMQYSGGTQRTVQVSKPHLVPDKTVNKRKTLSIRLSGGRPSITHKKRRPKPVIPKTKLTFARQTKTYKTRATPSNKFLEALTAIERGVADAKAAQRRLRYSARKLHSLKSTIKLAAAKRMFQFSRHRLGEAFFLIRSSGAASSRPKRSSQTQASSFMDDLKRSMGPTTFDEFMAVMGDVTLMFAIDTTGSMGNDIAIAKRIAVDIVNYPRQIPVSYILSPFNDPATGPVTFKDFTQGAEFVQAISNLKANGGGDCAELTFKGILDALYEGPDWGSPLYVFTDASAKDATPSNMDEVKSMAKYLGTTINFFSTGDCHLSNNSFQEVAEATSGQLLSLSSYTELQQLTGFTGSVLGGSNIISYGSNMSNRKKRRAVGNQRYSIKIDDSIEKMSVCITTEIKNQGNLISLTDSGGATITSGKLSMSKVSVYEITRPSVGTWTLVIPSSAGKHDYFVKSSSDTNIDFEYYFVFEIQRPRSEVPISDPLIGQQNKLVLTVAGYHKVQKNTVVLELISKYGEYIRDVVSLTPDAQGMRYVGTFTPPSQPFKLKIKGITKAGNAFERISRNIIEPKHILLRVLHSDKDFTLRRGQTSTVTFHMYNAASVNKVVNIQVKDRLGCAKLPSRSSRTVRRRRPAFFSVKFKTPRGAGVGVGDTAVVSISVNNGAERSSITVQLIVAA